MRKLFLFAVVLTIWATVATGAIAQSASSLREIAGSSPGQSIHTMENQAAAQPQLNQAVSVQETEEFRKLLVIS